ncbi:hypothetical protein COS91_03395 [Candidatus Desantisbacteria bacterium CG07_land_8_20_14_0_80_39_15]|uniref:AbiEi antitoxin C-terminal domain-containing protein n=3 Tax=unclassified Candidatus Desantisiibacteriota TaxID=3106372 RepID=A0A2H9PBD7_9BACT|nr:MAG: hypothetical protein COS91_03395 [Candidatus Desantisbacteria bacterium CG07_land_8_20_14_0_80_39_15]PIZ16056.1 MAG: hypothetical protein COY51_03690 [Candidatus Desantisbacteria bacterium CG_4_10_14_0_8_um_filter_39_17]
MGYNTSKSLFHLISKMAKKLNWYIIENELIKKGFTIFTPRDLQRLFHTSEVSIRFLLHRYFMKGMVGRLRKGYYFFPSSPPSELQTANALYRPSYISFEYALAFYHIIPEAAYSVTSATTKPTRIFQPQNKTYEYRTIKKEVYFGYIPHRIGNVVVLIAEPEKALVDYIYFVALGKKTLNERFLFKGLQTKKIMKYAKVFKNNRLLELLRKILL